MPEDSEKEKLDLLRGLTDQAFEGIKAEMKRLKLDRGKAAYRRPLDLLEEAYLAIRYPVAAKGGASLPLLALRGAIDRSVEELVRRSPAQQKGEKRRDRILSIGLHCGKKGPFFCPALQGFRSASSTEERSARRTCAARRNCFARSGRSSAAWLPWSESSRFTASSSAASVSKCASARPFFPQCRPMDRIRSRRFSPFCCAGDLRTSSSTLRSIAPRSASKGRDAPPLAATG